MPETIDPSDVVSFQPEPRATSSVTGPEAGYAQGAADLINAGLAKTPEEAAEMLGPGESASAPTPAPSSASKTIDPSEVVSFEPEATSALDLSTPEGRIAARRKAQAEKTKTEEHAGWLASGAGLIQKALNVAAIPQQVVAGYEIGDPSPISRALEQVSNPDRMIGPLEQARGSGLTMGNIDPEFAEQNPFVSSVIDGLAGAGNIFLTDPLFAGPAILKGIKGAVGALHGAEGTRATAEAIDATHNVYGVPHENAPRDITPQERAGLETGTAINQPKSPQAQAVEREASSVPEALSSQPGSYAVREAGAEADRQLTAGADPAALAKKIAKVVDTDPRATVYELPARTIASEPDTFQFRGPDAKPTEIKKWDNDLAGTTTVWRSKNGENFIVDGHSRLAAARKLHGEDFPIRAQILDEGLDVPGALAHNISAKDARTYGAVKNIVAGRADSIDAARVMREEGLDAERVRFRYPDPDATRARMEEAASLSHLDDGLFRKVERGEIPKKLAAAVGRYSTASDVEWQTRALANAKLLGLEKSSDRVLNDVMLMSQGSAIGPRTVEQASFVDEIRKSLSSAPGEKTRTIPETGKRTSERSYRDLYALERDAYNPRTEIGREINRVADELVKTENKAERASIIRDAQPRIIAALDKSQAARPIAPGATPALELREVGEGGTRPGGEPIATPKAPPREIGTPEPPAPTRPPEFAPERDPLPPTGDTPSASKVRAVANSVVEQAHEIAHSEFAATPEGKRYLTLDSLLSKIAKGDC